jgi:PTH1 family peptidyl-tRNA hydrolase
MSPSDFRLVVGLGNPGSEYAGTRHNVGFEVLDETVRRLGGSWEEDRKWKALKYRDGEVLYMKPLTYMNLSGGAVRKAADYFKILPTQILIVYDEMSLALGRLRLRKSGSAAGHNGIRSVMEHFASEAVPRLRVGIGESGCGDAVGHVLGRFSECERSLVARVICAAADAVGEVISQGFDSTMNRFNALKLDA